MKKTIFDDVEVKEILDKLANHRREIEELEANINENLQELDEMIRQQLIAFNWKPCYNEKAINVNLEQQTAWYVWYIESWASYNRFKEAPAEFKAIHNYCRQDIVPEEQNSAHSWILPLALFDELKNLIPFHIYPEKHKDY